MTAKKITAAKKPKQPHARLRPETETRLKRQISARMKRTGTNIFMSQHLDDLAKIGDKHFL